MSYKGFKWEPMAHPWGRGERSGDFIASRRNEASFYGTVLSLGMERPSDGRPVTVVVDDGEKAGRLARLEARLAAAVIPLDKAAADAGVPLVVAMVNYDPNWRFEDLSLLLEDESATAATSVDLFIWFDDYRSDRMLFRRSDTAAYESLFNWFHTA